MQVEGDSLLIGRQTFQPIRRGGGGSVEFDGQRPTAIASARDDVGRARDHDVVVDPPGYTQPYSSSYSPPLVVHWSYAAYAASGLAASTYDVGSYAPQRSDTTS